MVRRAIQFSDRVSVVLKTIELTKVTEVKLSKPLLHLDEIAANEWRLTYSVGFIDDFKLIEGIQFEDREMILVGLKEDNEYVVMNSVPCKLIPVSADIGMFHIEQDARGNYKVVYNSDLVSISNQYLHLSVIREE